MTTQMTIKPFLLLGICLLLAFPCELRANQLKQPGLVDATVETTITEVEKLFIKYPELAIQIRTNMVSVAHNPKVFDGMVKRLKDLSRTPTFLDSAYTLKAIHDIIKLTEPEEKAASAAGTAVGYLGNVVGNVAVATKMAGSSGILTLGGGFLPGLVVSLSAKAVTEMTTEAIMLYYDRQNAAFKERWAEIELRENAIRGLLRVNDLLKAGKLDEAQTYLTRIQKYLINNSFPKDGIFDQIDRLSGLIKKAEDKAWANRIIAEARVSFQQAYRWAVLGRNLSTAKRLVQEAITVLQSGVSRVPELQANIDKCERLHAYIDGLIAEAPPLGAVSVSGPDQVAAGESCEFELRVTGGLPDYQPIDMFGYAHATGATVYWEAPADPGKKSLTFRIRDDRGQTAEAVKEVEVAGEAAALEQAGEMTGELWEVMKDTPMLSIIFEPFASTYGTKRKTIEAEVSPGTDMAFPVSYTEHGFRYEGRGRLQFSADGKTISQLSIDLDIGNDDYGVMGKEEIRLGPFRDVSIDPDYNLNYKGKEFVYKAKDGLQYVYAVGDREERGTYRYGDHAFSDTGKGLQKGPFAWKDVEKVEFSPDSNAWHMFSTVKIRFNMK